MFVEAGVAELGWAEVDEMHRRQGVGAVTVTAAMGQAWQRGARLLVLWTDVDNEAMRNLARRSGFSEGPDQGVGHRRGWQNCIGRA